MYLINYKLHLKKKEADGATFVTSCISLIMIIIYSYTYLTSFTRNI